MARRAQGTVYRPSRGQGKRKARFYWCGYRDHTGKPRRHVLKLASGERITDRSVAESELGKIINRQERLAAGLVDQEIEAASTPMRVVLGRYVRHLRRNLM